MKQLFEQSAFALCALGTESRLDVDLLWFPLGCALYFSKKIFGILSFFEIIRFSHSQIIIMTITSKLNDVVLNSHNES